MAFALPISRHGPILRWINQNRSVVFPLMITTMILVILIPLPTPLLDILLVSNITLAALILLNTVYVSDPLELSVFPSLLLSTTLMRLVLNIASTRLILTA